MNYERTVEMALTPRENLLRVLRHQEPEWIPCAPHIASMANIPGQLPACLLKEPLDRLAVSRYVGGDVLYEICAHTTEHGGNVLVKSHGEKDIINDSIETPLGKLSSARRAVRVPNPDGKNIPPDCVPAPSMRVVTTTEHYIKSVEDYKILRFLFESRSFKFSGDEVNSALRAVNNDGVVVLSGPSSPFYSLIGELAGLQRTVYDIYDNPAELESTMDVMAAKSCEWYKQAAATDVEVIRCTEDLDTKLVSPEMFRKYSVPALRKYSRICHDAGKLLLVHMCGHIREFLPFIPETEADAIHCLCPPQTGNTPVKLAREILGRNVTIMARIDPPVLLNGDPDTVSLAVTGMLREAAPADNFMFILPCGRAPLANIKTVIQTVRRQGDYPVADE
jgi:uroporphyrinogen-III decarboxylase